MKKMLALFLSFVLVFAFAGCSSEPSTPSDSSDPSESSASSESSESSESSLSSVSINYDVFKEIEQKSKRFDENLSFDSIEIVEENDEHGLAAVGATGKDFEMLVYYDSEEYKISSHPKIISLFLFADDIHEERFLNICKSILLIDEWGLTIDDLKRIENDFSFSVETESGERLQITTDIENRGFDVCTEELVNYY